MLLLSKKKDYRYFLFFIMLLVVSLLVCLFLMERIANQQIDAAKEDYESVAIAYEASRTSDNATKMLRLYIITGQEKYRQIYNQIVGIRTGSIPKPKNYSNFYWDVVQEPIKPQDFTNTSESLKSEVLRHKFSLSELGMLNTTQDKAQQLLHLENKALNAMDGKMEDASGNFTIQEAPNQDLAKKIIFGEEYQKLKMGVMKPLQEFYQHVVHRTEQTENQFDRKIQNFLALAILLSTLITVLLLISIFKVLNSVSESYKQSESLLLNILPTSIAARLKGGEEHIADSFTSASVLFADIINFTKLAKELGPKETVKVLNALFDAFDILTEQYKVERVKTIGDNYMVVSGVPNESTEHARRLADFALAMLVSLKQFNSEHNMNLQLRIGLACGPVVAGIIGHKKFVYDVWGNVVNLASRLEGLSKPNTILISEKMAHMLDEDYDLAAQPEVDIKGIGPQLSYILLGRKTI